MDGADSSTDVADGADSVDGADSGADGGDGADSGAARMAETAQTGVWMAQTVAQTRRRETAWMAQTAADGAAFAGIPCLRAYLVVFGRSIRSAEKVRAQLLPRSQDGLKEHPDGFPKFCPQVFKALLQ